MQRFVNPSDNSPVSQRFLINPFVALPPSYGLIICKNRAELHLYSPSHVCTFPSFLSQSLRLTFRSWVFSSSNHCLLYFSDYLETKSDIIRTKQE